MKKSLFAILSLWLCLTNAMAGTWSAETLPMPYLQEATHHTCNPDNILGTQAVDSINKLLTHLQEMKGVQAICVVVEHLEGDDPYAFNRDLFKKYGIGQKEKNNGLVITLATQDRSYQISPGEGLEKMLPDVVCSRIENRVMVPKLAEGNWDEAMTGTVNTIFGLLTGDESTQKAIGAFLSQDDEDTGSGRSVLNFILGTLLMPIVAIVGFIYALIWRSKRRKCPHCGKKLAQKRTSRKVNLLNDETQQVTEIWTCLKCGKTDVIDKLVPLATDDDDDNHSSSSHHSSSSSSSSGGSFGGGSYGGGGAGGRF